MKPCVIDTDTVVDNTIINNTLDIKMINIDYTISSRVDVIFDKCFKCYQGPEKLLIIVILTSKKKVLPKEFSISIPYNQNVKVFNAQEFAQYIGYYGGYLNNYNLALSLIIRAFYDDTSYFRLEALGKKAKKKLDHLSQQYSMSQKEFEKYLKSGTGSDITYLLQKSVSDVNLDRFL